MRQENEGVGRAPFPWIQAMGIAFGQLGISPQVFWSMTPRELAAVFSGFAGGNLTDTLTRSGLQDLMKQFPDRS